MSDRDPNFSIRDYVILGLKRRGTDLASAERAKRWSDWLQFDLKVPETPAVLIGSTAELLGRAAKGVADLGHMATYTFVTGMEGVSEAFDDESAQSLNPVRGIKRAILNRYQTPEHHIHAADGGVGPGQWHGGNHS